MDLSRYHRVMTRMTDAATRSGRDPSEVTLVVVSKGRTADQVMALYEDGQRDFGENRAAEMSAKVDQLPGDIRWHFVGSLQTNKVRLMRGRTHLLHSLDRYSLAKAWIKGIGESPPVLIQVNIGKEEQKGGALPEMIGEMVAQVPELGLRLQGLMAIPPIGDDPEESRVFFVKLRNLRESLATDELPLDHLSMGMTDDFEVAIEEGASIIRVGRAIFEPTH